MNYKVKGAALRLRDILDQMENKPVVYKPVTYSEQEKAEAKNVLHTILAKQYSGKVISNKVVIKESNE